MKTTVTTCPHCLLRGDSSDFAELTVYPRGRHAFPAVNICGFAGLVVSALGRARAAIDNMEANRGGRVPVKLSLFADTAVRIPRHFHMSGNVMIPLAFGLRDAQGIFGGLWKYSV